LTLPTEFLPLLRERFGTRLSLAPAILEQHGRGESYHAGMPPEAVVFATTTQEVSDIVRLCAEWRVPLIAFGAGTSLEGNVSAVAGGVSIDLTQMNAVLRLGTEDMDCTVEAGVTRLQLNRELRHTGLFFPLDPGADATIGGMAATRASGTNAVRYGTMREAVLALTVVLADGGIIRTSRRARKSSAGYDLTRLFVGSEGTLGIITEVTLRLHGVPEALGSLSCVFPDLESAVRTVTSVIQCGVPIARVELLDDAQIRATNRFSKLDLPVADTLMFEFHGTDASVAEQAETVRAIAAELGGHDFRTATTQEERSVLWKARHDAFYATTALRPDAKGWSTDVCVPIANLVECIARTKTLLAATSVPATIVGHVGDGNFHVIFAVDRGNARELDELADFSAALAALAIELDGTCTGEHGIGTGKLDYMEAEHGDAVDVMRKIKDALDPLHILNPGKVIPPRRATEAAREHPVAVPA
jgi:D-lactate dehydrogenase (cytochrome)